MTQPVPGPAKSGGDAIGIVGVVVVGVAVRVDKAEIVAVAGIDGPTPGIGRRQTPPSLP